ncbi:MAG: LysM peptidoglycan-binding domain-containing protein [Verrucomicrobiales bacterium]|jgi:LysM repeat protein|nr:LysM peptidoglycan-binding domain-containing protein [Verrucomicrobiales bacterium]MBP9225291.1 LysM peptidoglycan-binding domain-containing protein [Verrucomicrobiales bacterium]HQZ27839.1 LysM peptidoglycan-binding domain-containing protein [Verrucomicrobiales bacterium]
MARIKYLLAFFAMLICIAGVGGAYYYWTKFAQPEIVVNRHISGKSGDTLERPDLGKRHFDAAMDLIKTGELVSARDRLLYLMEYFPESATFGEARRIVGELNLDLLISKIPIPGKTEHTVKRGEALVTIAKRSKTTIDYVMRANAKTSEFIFPDEVLTVYPLNFRVLINLVKKTVTVLDGEHFFKEYTILDSHLPADLRAPVSTTVSEKVAWDGSKPINFTDTNYMDCAKWLRTGKIGLFIRQLDEDNDSSKQARPYGVMLAKPDVEELFTILREGSKVDLEK